MPQVGVWCFQLVFSLMLLISMIVLHLHVSSRQRRSRFDRTRVPSVDRRRTRTCASSFRRTILHRLLEREGGRFTSRDEDARRALDHAFRARFLRFFFVVRPNFQRDKEQTYARRTTISSLRTVFILFLRSRSIEALSGSSATC